MNDLIILSDEIRFFDVNKQTKIELFVNNKLEKLHFIKYN